MATIVVEFQFKMQEDENIYTYRTKFPRAGIGADNIGQYLTDTFGTA